MATSQITVRARDCVPRARGASVIGETLAYRGHEWMVVGVFMGLDPVTTEVEEYLVLEQRRPLWTAVSEVS